MFIKDKDSLYAIIKASLNIFYPLKKKQFHFLLFIIFVYSIIDVLSLSIIVPIIYLINDTGLIQQNPFLSYLYQRLNFQIPGHFVLFLLVGLVIIIIFKNIFRYWTVKIQNKFVFSVCLDLIERQMTRFYKAEYLQVNSVEYLRSLALAPQEFANGIMLPLALLLNEVLVLIIILTALVFYYPIVVLLLFIAIVPVSLVLFKTAHKRLLNISKVKGELENDAYRIALEGINAYSDIKLTGKEDYIIRSLKNIFKVLYDACSKANLYYSVPREIIEILVILTICILYAIASISFGPATNKIVLLLITFSTAAYRLLPSVNDILVNMVRMKTSKYVLNQLSFVEENIKKRDYASLRFDKSIQLKDINFKYPENNQNTLNKINLHINKGDFIIITGESGNGKTTIAKIITGFIRPDSGELLIDNIKVEHFDQIKHLIGYVTQDFFLYDTSLLENIAIHEDSEKTDLERVYAIIRSTGLEELMNTLPSGIYHQIGERGAKLSGGQKQRIAIARALYKKNQVLVLDEPTGSLDKENEMELLDTIYNLSKNENISVVIITHRINAVNYFDAIYELDNGILKVRIQ